VAYSADGRFAVTGSDDGTARLWRTPGRAGGSGEQVLATAGSLTGMQLDADGAMHVVSATGWQQSSQRLSQAARAIQVSADVQGWHRQEAKASEAAGQWLTAGWHLQRLIENTPKAWPLYLRRGNAYFQSRQIQKAEADFDKGVENGPQVWVLPSIAPTKWRTLWNS